MSFRATRDSELTATMSKGGMILPLKGTVLDELGTITTKHLL